MRTVLNCILVGLLLGLGVAIARAQEPIAQLMVPIDLDTAKAELGKKLFFDPRLSKSGFISCNSCHNLRNL